MTRNVAASIRQHLLNKARAENRPFGELLQYFALERFLYRLGRSPYSGRFVLKGALMFGAVTSRLCDVATWGRIKCGVADRDELLLLALARFLM
jgi:hypothetical protein